MILKLLRLNYQKKFIVFIRLVMSSIITKIFSIICFSLFYIFLLDSIITEDPAFNPSFFDLLNIFVLFPQGHFSLYIFSIIFWIIGMVFTYGIFIDTKLINSFKINKFIMNYIK